MTHEEVRKGEVEIRYVTSEENVADILTKPLLTPSLDCLKKTLMGRFE